MSEDTFTEVTSESWMGRLGGAIKGVIFGVILVVVAFPILFLNEGRAVKTAKSLEEGAASVVSVSADAVVPGNDGSLVHVTGDVTTQQELKDDRFAVTVTALRLDRFVEMYQWEESKSSKTEKKLGGGTETVTNYSYNKVWSNRHIDSTRFKRSDGHQNPTEIPFSEESFVATQATLGAYEVPEGLLDALKADKQLVLKDAALIQGVDKPFQIEDGAIYVGDSVSSPRVGDMRITFRYVPAPTTATIVAQQNGNSFMPYQTSAGRRLFILVPGSQSADAVFEAKKQANAGMTWLLRFGGFVTMLVGLLMILKPLSVLGDVIPIVGSFIEMGSFLVAGVISAGVSIVVISIAWIFYRPILGIPLLILGLGLLAFMFMKSKQSPKTAVEAAG